MDPSEPSRSQSVTSARGDASAGPTPRVAVRLDRLDAVVCAGLALATAVAFAPLARAGFISFDDPLYVTDNAMVKRGLTVEGLEWAFTTGEAANWHPVTWLSHQLDCTLFGLDPTGPHLVNVALHGLSSLLLFALLRVGTGARWRSALVASLFALHPAHVESVAWIAERKDVLSTLFWFAAVALYGRWTRRPRLGTYLGLVGALALGLMSKPMLVTLPFTLLLLDVWPLRRLTLPPEPGAVASLARAVLEKLPLFALVAVSAVVTILTQDRGGSVIDLDQLPLAQRLANVPVSYLRYLGLLAWPTGLAVYYPLGPPWPLPWTAGAVAVLVAVTALAWLYRRPHPSLLVGWLLFLGTLVPVIGLVQVGLQSIADRYTYVPSVGLFLAAAWLLPALASRLPRGEAVVGGVTALLVGTLGVGTHLQARRWVDNETLFRHALQVSREFNVHAHFEVGVEDLRRGELETARGHFTAILARFPAHADANAGLGAVLATRGELPAAIARFERALRTEPSHLDARRNRALALADLGRKDEAAAEFAEVLRRAPEDPVAHHRLGRLLAERREWEPALEHLRRAAVARPSDFGVQLSLLSALAGSGRAGDAIALLPALERLAAGEDELVRLATASARLGQPARAAAAFERAVAVAPESAAVHARYGAFLASMRRTEPALVHLARAARLEPGNAAHGLQLARTLLDAGREAEARQHLEALRDAFPADPKVAAQCDTLLAMPAPSAAPSVAPPAAAPAARPAATPEENP